MLTLFKQKVHPLQKWLDQYAEDKGKKCPHAVRNSVLAVNDFINWVDENIEIYDITEEMVRDHLRENYLGVHRILRDDARKGINAWLRYWRMRGHKYLPQVFFYEDERWWNG